MSNFEPKPEGMSYAEWLRQKNISIKVEGHPIHKDSGMPQEYISKQKNRTNEIFELNLARQGKKLDPEDIEGR